MGKESKWRVETIGNIVAVVGKDDQEICRITAQENEEKIARQICALPEMLEALKRIERTYGAAQVSPAWKAVRAAIAKAEGFKP